MKSKSEASNICQDILKLLAVRQGSGISLFRTDGGSEYQSIALQEYLKTNGIDHEVTPPYTPELNGMAERLNRTLIERVRCYLFLLD